MRDSMLHRGPDGCGLELFEEGRVGLAHRRLAIIDLSSAGHEPMSFRNGRYWLTFNGEIYNAADLRETLKAQGCSFRSHCDAEVILAAYATWGKACVQRFQGMWAFAIWDQQEKMLFCSRDRFGIKPFYYYDDGDLFIFASEIRAILASGVISPHLHPPAIVAYLNEGLLDGLDETFFAGIQRLQPGTCLIRSEQEIKTWRYWDVVAAPFSSEIPWAADIDQIRWTFDEAVRSHLVSDAPIGISLSGGLDSSAIFAMASKYSREPIRTFTSYYDESGPYDERQYSDQMIARFPAEAYQVRPNRDDLYAILPRLLWHLEEPPLAHGVYPRWHVAQLASGHVKVLLVGQGGDELLAGYSYYFKSLLLDYFSRGKVLAMCREILATWQHHGNPFPADVLKASFRKRLPHWMKRTFSQGPTSALGPLLQGVTPSSPRMQPLGVGHSRLNSHLWYDTVNGILPTLLRYEDKIDMAFSIEGRVPFLDHRFAERAFSLGVKAKIRDGWSKVILRDAMDSLLPHAIQWRRDKVGFPTPYDRWFEGPLFKEAESRIMESGICREGYLDRSQVERLLREHQQGKRKLSTWIWKWLCLAQWYEGRDHLTDRTYAAQPISGR